MLILCHCCFVGLCVICMYAQLFQVVKFVCVDFRFATQLQIGVKMTRSILYGSKSLSCELQRSKCKSFAIAITPWDGNLCVCYWKWLSDCIGWWCGEIVNYDSSNEEIYLLNTTLRVRFLVTPSSGISIFLKV